MQIIGTLRQTDSHASTSSLDFLQAWCSSWRPTNSVKASKHWKTYFGEMADKRAPWKTTSPSAFRHAEGLRSGVNGHGSSPEGKWRGGATGWTSHLHIRSGGRTNIINVIQRQRLRWYGHVLRRMKMIWWKMHGCVTLYTYRQAKENLACMRLHKKIVRPDKYARKMLRTVEHGES